MAESITSLSDLMDDLDLEKTYDNTGCYHLYGSLGMVEPWLITD